MILVCPNCDARYRIADDAIPAQGRRVRCATCQHEWTEPAPVAAETAPPPAPPAASPPASPAASPPASPPASDAVSAPLAAAPEPEPEPVIDPPPRRSAWLKTLVALVLGAALTLTAVAIWGAQFGLDLSRFIDLPALRVATPAAAAKPVVEPLAIAFTVQIGVLPNGTNLLSVSGEVTNPTRVRQTVPPIEAVLHDFEGRAVYSWEVAPPAPALEPGASVAFDTSASNFPNDAMNLTLDFRPR